jgi:hypothetical protein
MTLRQIVFVTGLQDLSNILQKEIPNMGSICFKKWYVCGPRCFAQICRRSGKFGR